MVRWSIVGLAAVLPLQACAPQPPKSPISQFNEAEIAWSKRTGTSTISGQGFMRQQGGGVVTCAGEDVVLTPVSSYSSERIAILYNDTNKGFNPIGFGSRNITAPPSEYLASSRRATCNAQGNFKFNSLPPGEFFVTTSVRWMAGNSPQGSFLMERVRVSEGREVEVVLTPR